MLGSEEPNPSVCLRPAGLSVLRSSEDQLPSLQTKSIGDIEELAASYERKLIEVSVSSASDGHRSILTLGQTELQPFNVS